MISARSLSSLQRHLWEQKKGQARARVRDVPRVCCSRASPRFARLLQTSSRQGWSPCRSPWTALWVIVFPLSKVQFCLSFVFWRGQHPATSTVNSVFLKVYIRRSWLRHFCSSNALMWSPGHWLLLPALNDR